MLDFLLAELLDTPLTTLLAMLAALFALLEFRNNRQQHKREYTFAMVMDVMKDPNLATGYRLVEDSYMMGKGVDVGQLSDEQEKSYLLMLGTMEYIAFAYKEKSVALNTVDNTILHRLQKTYHVSQGYIKEKRKSDPLYYEHLEYVARYGARAKDFAKRYARNQTQ